MLQICDNILKIGLGETDFKIVMKVIKTLKILQNQYEMIEELYALRGNLESNRQELDSLEKKYSILQEFLIKLNSIEDFCVPMLLKIDPFFLEMLKHFERKLKKLLGSWQTSKKTYYFNYLSIYVTKNISWSLNLTLLGHQIQLHRWIFTFYRSIPQWGFAL